MDMHVDLCASLYLQTDGADRRWRQTVVAQSWYVFGGAVVLRAEVSVALWHAVRTVARAAHRFLAAAEYAEQPRRACLLSTAFRASPRAQQQQHIEPIYSVDDISAHFFATGWPISSSRATRLFEAAVPARTRR